MSFGYNRCGAETVPRRLASPDVCGVTALYTLLRLEGHRVSLPDLCADLPVGAENGLSFQDLKRTARRYGLELRGVRIERTGRSPTRPTLVFTRHDSPTGHFLVIRPVGDSGRLVQVFDGLKDPEVIDADAFESRLDWTGLALIPAAASWFGSWLGSAVLSAGLVLVFWMTWRIAPAFRRRIRPQSQ